MIQGGAIRATFGGVIVVDENGRETHYTPEAWMHKQLMDKLEAIDKRLEVIEKTLGEQRKET